MDSTSCCTSYTTELFPDLTAEIIAVGRAIGLTEEQLPNKCRGTHSTKRGGISQERSQTHPLNPAGCNEETADRGRRPPRFSRQEG